MRAVEMRVGEGMGSTHAVLSDSYRSVIKLNMDNESLSGLSPTHTLMADGCRT